MIEYKGQYSSHEGGDGQSKGGDDKLKYEGEKNQCYLDVKEGMKEKEWQTCRPLWLPKPVQIANL